MKQKKWLAFLTAAVLGAVGFPSVPTSAADSDDTANKARVSVHDPSIMKDPNTGMYYVFGSHIDAAKSSDLQNWNVFTNGYAATGNQLFGNLSSNLAGAFAWAGENLEDCEGGFAVWAPDVIWNPDYVNPDGTVGAYLMYFCTSSTYMRSVIAYAASKTPEGPYQFVDTLIYSGFTSGDSYATSSTKNVNRKYTSTNIDELIAAGQVTYNEAWFNKGNFNNQLYPNAIDPTIYYDTDGTMYMCYGSWSGGIFTLEMDPKTGKCIHPKTGTTADGRMVDSYFGTKISGGFGKSGEGPFIEYHAETGYYYLWVTYGGLTSTGGYNMRVFRSKSPTGPFTDAANRNAVLETSGGIDGLGVKVMTNYQLSCLPTAYMACGHNSVLRDDDGKWYLFYHTRFDDGFEYHEVRVHAMTFNEAGWPVVMPFEYSGETWSEKGYVPSELVGTYEFVNHGTATNGNITKSSEITLNADGSISGAASGRWTEAKGSAAATLTIDSVVYRGYFNAQYDESKTGRRVMTFTGVGNNNMTVWAVKKDAWNGAERSLLDDHTNSDSKLFYAAGTVTASEGNVTIGATTLLSGIPYVISNVHSGLVIDLPSGNTEDGTGIHQWARNAGSNQEWRITDLGNGYCKIVSMADERKCIAVSAPTAEDGADIVLQSYTGAENQQWKLQSLGGLYAILSRCSNDTGCLDVYEWSTENGGVIKQWNSWGGECQLWAIEPVRPAVPEGHYTLRNINSGYWVGMSTDGLIQSDIRRVWTFTKTDDGYYTISNGNGLAVTVADETDGAALTLEEDRQSDAQKFAVQCNYDGSYALLSYLSAKKSGFDVYEISMENGAAICQWNYWGGAGQRFVPEPSQAPPPAETTTTTTTTTTTMETTKSEPMHTMRGDVDCDGEVTISDVIMLSRLNAEDPQIQLTVQGKRNAECSGDGILTGADVVLILRHIARLITLS